MLEKESHAPTLQDQNSVNQSFNEAMDNFEANWIWRATHALIDHQDFDSTASWIAKKLNVTVEEATEALEGLVKLGLVGMSEKGYVKKRAQYFLPEEKQKESYRIKSHCQLSHQILNSLLASEKGILASSFVASSREKVLRFYENLQKLLEEFDEESQKEQNKDGVYAITFTGLKISDRLKNDEGVDS